MNGRPTPPPFTSDDNSNVPAPRAVPARFWLVVAGFMFFYLLVRFGVGLYTELLWFEHLSFESVFFTGLWARLGVGFAVGIPVAALFISNALIARWLSIRNVLFFSEEVVVAQKLVGGLIWILGILLAWIIGSAASGNWLIFLSYLYQKQFGITDPVFDMDASFYVFSLPVYSFMQSWILVALFLGLFASLAVYALAQQNTIAEGRLPVILPHIQLHLSVIGALIFLTFAWGHWLSLFSLLYSDRGVAFGASYTDINVTMPALWTMVAMAIIAATVLLLNIFLRKPALSLAVIFGWVIVGAIGTGLIPNIVQRYIVIPNELASESPYIRNNIDFTSWAYGLDKVVEKSFANPVSLTPDMAEKNATTLKNIRLWDYRPLQQTYKQIQSIRLYYTFNDIDLDRYIVDDELRQVAISVRELDKRELQQTWVTQKLQFTHGYGVVANPVNEVSEEGLPKLWIQDLPPESDIGIDVTRPEIYYGELTNDYVFVKTTEREFNYPSGDTNVYNDYNGTGGVLMDTYIKRLAFAIGLSDINMMLSQEFTRESRVMLHRSIKERVQSVAPFLLYDGDPYIVVDKQGHLNWIQDAYTYTDLFPYSEPIGGLNYIRNSVKVVVDAYDGDITFYVVDDSDPIIQAYGMIFPELFTPLSEMPPDLFDNTRYPEDLFRVQSELFLTYHMQDVNVFYNKEDLWQLPKEHSEGTTKTLEPYYVILSLPDSEQDEFLLIQPFTPSSKDNMIAWMAARADGDSYGELVVFRFPKQELIFGPLQIEARIDQDPEISAQISLWNQSGSEVIRGNLLVLPIEDSLLYVEPLYLQAESGEIPELKRVIVATGDKIAMEKNLGEALESLFNKKRQKPLADNNNTDTGPSAEPLPDVDTTNVSELAELASFHYNAAQTAAQRGDWATYGDKLRELEAVLQTLLEVTASNE
ncbi:UPF0182 family protein [Anaerolineales bacterium HSG25]|nr:UPF0182 family protein [Anaerolineales bacterium HSG25]